MSIALERVSKRFGGQTTVDRVSLEVPTGELFVLLGASGSGKSTILRLISGLIEPDEGVIKLGGKDITALPPQKRDVGFVFQNYSIFRHMTVGENIEFGLRIRRVPSAERQSRRDELLDLVGLGGLGSRYSNQLSGGQRQRVALARALAYRPGVLLLDEPFGALDVKIRSQLRQNLKDVQKSLGVTTILVTHDQEEAFELGQRIGVVDHGRLLEVDQPENLYRRPQSLFVATFLGAGTVLVGRSRGDRVEVGTLKLPIPADVPHGEGDRVRVLFRPEHVKLDLNEPPSSAYSLGRGELIEESFVGALRRARVRMPPVPGTRQLAPPLPFGEEALRVDATVPADGRPLPRLPWVTIEQWHILRQPTPRVLICDRGAGATLALEMARPLVQALNGSATVLGVSPSVSEQDALRADLGRRAAEAGLMEASIETRAGDPAEQIALAQADVSYDFVIVGEQDGSGRRRGIALTEELVPQISTPILLARGNAKRPQTILICTAVGEPGKADVRIGGWLARRLEASTTLLHVTLPGRTVPIFVRTHLDGGVATLRELGVQGRSVVREADSALEGILKELDTTRYDLVVVGAPAPRGRAGLRGEVTLRILRETKGSVLIVPQRAL